MSIKWARIRKILNPELDKTLKEILEKLYDEHSIEDIAQMCQYNCGRTALREKMIELNIPIKGRGRYNYKRKIHIPEEDLLTLSPKEIAARNGVSVNTIKRRIKERIEND